MRRALLLLIPLVLFVACSPAPAKDSVSVVSRRLAAWPKDARCPAEVMSSRQDLALNNDCQTSPSERCLNRCENGHGEDCYWLALGIQERDEQSSEALFQRACSLGVASGCTNRAAGMLRAAGDDDDRVNRCAAATFEKACAFDDPWACTMYASMLVRGAGVPPNPKLALRILEKSCTYGPEDPACENANRIREELAKSGVK